MPIWKASCQWALITSFRATLTWEIAGPHHMQAWRGLLLLVHPPKGIDKRRSRSRNKHQIRSTYLPWILLFKVRYTFRLFRNKAALPVHPCSRIDAILSKVKPKPYIINQISLTVTSALEGSLRRSKRMEHKSMLPHRRQPRPSTTYPALQ